MSRRGLEESEHVDNIQEPVAAVVLENDGPDASLREEIMTEEVVNDSHCQFERDGNEPQGLNSINNEDVRYPDTLLPIPIPAGYPDINFKPLILDYKVLIGILTFNLLCTGSIIVLLYRADRNYQYHTTYNNIYLVVRYVPTVVGTITTVVFRSLRDTFCRIQPYISMADKRGTRECRGSKSVGQLYMRGVPVYDSATWSKEGRHSLRLTFWIANFVVVQITGYKASLFSTAHSDEGWLVTVHYQIAWVLFAIYVLISFLCSWMLWKMLQANTGLKWDPVRIVDILALFHGSNVLEDFEELESLPNQNAFELLRNKTYRLGYWEKGTEKKIWYGIGRQNIGSTTSVGVPVAGDHLHNPIETAHVPIACLAIPRMDHSNGPLISYHRSNKDIAESREREHRPFCGHISYRINDPWSRAPFPPWTIFFWYSFVIGTLGLFIYTIASGIVHKGFNIPTHNPRFNSSIPGQFTYNVTSSGGDIIIANFDPGNGILWALFCFRTILVILASYMAITWFGAVDESIRFIQPFKNMHNKAVKAEDSILLNYLWGMPGLTSITALLNKHWKVAWFSFISFFSPTFPILVGGIFEITNTGKRIYFTITPATFYLVFVYLIIYAISIPLAWPGKDRRLMRYHKSIGDYTSLFYASYLIYDPDSSLDISAPNITQRHLESKVFLEEKSYAIGFYRGVDAKCHFGLDVATLDIGVGEEVQHVFFKQDGQEEKGKKRKRTKQARDDDV